MDNKTNSNEKIDRMTGYKIAIGIKEYQGRKSRIVAVGAAEAVAVYHQRQDQLERKDIAKGCEDRLEIILQGINALYHPFDMICPTIQERAKEQGIAIKTGDYKTINELVEDIDGLKDME